MFTRFDTIRVNPAAACNGSPQPYQRRVLLQERTQCHKHRHHNGRENQRRTIVGNNAKTAAPNSTINRKQLDAATTAPACEVQRSPPEPLHPAKTPMMTSAICCRGIPNDVPDHWNIRQVKPRLRAMQPLHQLTHPTDPASRDAGR